MKSRRLKWWENLGNEEDSQRSIFCNGHDLLLCTVLCTKSIHNLDRKAVLSCRCTEKRETAVGMNCRTSIENVLNLVQSHLKTKRFAYINSGESKKAHDSVPLVVQSCTSETVGAFQI